MSGMFTDADLQVFDNIIVSLPFHVVDALFDTWGYHMQQLPHMSLQIHRIERTTGSVWYDIQQTPQSPPVLLSQVGGRFMIRALSAQRTVITSLARRRAQEPELDGLSAILTSVLELHSSTVKIVSALETTQTGIPTVKPAPNASIDAWLDWRDAERQRKRTVKLEDIAKESIHSLATVKRHSALRRPPKKRG
jgi:hypothetical protein